MASTTDTTLSTMAIVQEDCPAVSLSAPATVDLSIYSPAPSPPAPATADPSLPEQVLTRHTAENTQRLELDSRLADTSARIFDLDNRITEFNWRIQDLADRRAPLRGELDSLPQSHTTLTSGRALSIASTAQRICALADTFSDFILSHALPIVTAARRAALQAPPTPSTPKSPNPVLSSRSRCFFRLT